MQIAIKNSGLHCTLIRFFDHKSKFSHRDKCHNDCFIGAVPLKDFSNVKKSCPCTGRNHACEFNYIKNTDGTCKLVPGLSAASRMSEICGKSGALEN